MGTALLQYRSSIYHCISLYSNELHEILCAKKWVIIKTCYTIPGVGKRPSGEGHSNTSIKVEVFVLLLKWQWNIYLCCLANENTVTWCWFQMSAQFCFVIKYSLVWASLDRTKKSHFRLFSIDWSILTTNVAYSGFFYSPLDRQRHLCRCSSLNRMYQVWHDNHQRD